MSALYGAAGVLHDRELTRVLLEGGADPNGEPHFGDALYHSVESERTECLRLLLAHGAEPNGTNALAHALDYEHTLEHVRVLLDAGADPSEGAIVAHAVRRGRGAEFVRLLAEHGADLDRPGGETWRGNVRLRTPYAQAVLRNRNDVAGALKKLGASTEIDPADRAIAAVARGETGGTVPAELDPDAQEVLILGALGGALEAVVNAVGVGFAGVVGGSPRGTLLHHASWVGDAQIVRTLLERGADPVARSGAEFDTPVAWALLASQYWRIEGRDYVRVVELLLDAGAELEPRFADVAEGPLAEWLEARL
jgi:ankyrin repeat protein